MVNAAPNLSAAAVEAAAKAIGPYLSPSPLRIVGSEAVALKLENHQPTGAFKVRGAFYRLLALSEAERSVGVIAASTGNHGAAVAHAAKMLQIPVTVFMPESVSPRKLDRLRGFGIRIELVQGDAVSAEKRARTAAKGSNQVYVSPYNDPWIVAGQGTIALEMLKQHPDLKQVFVAVGGGGLAGGMGLYLKERAPHVRLIGCQPKRSPIMSASVRAGRILEMEDNDTLSDGTAGGIETGALTFDLCKRGVDEWILVSEEEIREAIRWAALHAGERIEGAAGVALAAYLTRPAKNSAVIICGGNIDASIYEAILSQEPVAK